MADRAMPNVARSASDLGAADDSDAGVLTFMIEINPFRFGRQDAFRFLRPLDYCDTVFIFDVFPEPKVPLKARICPGFIRFPSACPSCLVARAETVILRMSTIILPEDEALDEGEPPLYINQIIN